MQAAMTLLPAKKSTYYNSACLKDHRYIDYIKYKLYLDLVDLFNPQLQHPLNVLVAKYEKMKP